MSERNLNNQTVSFEPSGIDDLYVNAAGVGALSLDEEPMMEPVAEATEVAEEGPFIGSQTSDNRGYVNLSGRVSETEAEDASQRPEPSASELERRASEPCARYRGRPAYRFAKRSFDVAASALALTLLSPLLLGVAIAVKVTDPGPAVFRQKRVGAGKDLFDMYKFRTMRADTPELPTHLIDANEWYTPIGATLRRLSLDELPQLANILKGDMSFVGPRPALWSQFDLVCERDRYGANAVRPGLTGWAQINGRDELSIEDKARFDGEYLSLMGPLFDLRCMFGTVGKVAGGAGIVEERVCGEGADRNHTAAGAPAAEKTEGMGAWPNS